MIIGRTKPSAESSFNSNLLTKERYYTISYLVRKVLIECKISELPIRLNLIIKKYSWKVHSYSTAKQFANVEELEIMKTDIGYAKINKDTGQYYIFYDESQPIEVQRFTIAHEIGHIFLDHFNITPQNREQEANMFAARLLMPLCVIYECGLRSPAEISKMCGVSMISAKFRYKRLLEVAPRNKFYTNKMEYVIYEQFKDFIAGNEFN